MASSSKELITNTEFEKLLCGEDDDFCDTDFNLESNVDSDHESIDSHDSNSIIEASESDDGYDASEFEEKLYIGKDKVSEWSAIPPPTSQMQRQNIVSYLSECKGLANKMEKNGIAETFALFFDDYILRMLVENTNIYIEKNVLPNIQRNRDARSVTKDEIKAFIGLLITAGVMRSSHLNFKELFSEENIASEFFYITMSYQRFLFILRCIRFDDIRTFQERLASDKLAPIRDLLDNIVNKFSYFFSPSKYMTIDEQLVAFRGHCPFRQYVPSNANHYGIKIFILCDVKHFYTLQMEVYLGNQPEGPYKVSYSPEDIVTRLIKPIDESGRNITIDNWYASIPLATRLLSENKLTVVGTLCKNKSEVPSAFLPNKNRAIKSTLFGFTDTTTLVSYVPKKSKAVLLLSTMHHDAAIDNEIGEEKQPEVLTFYNASKGGVATIDKLCAVYDVGRRTRRWPLALFFHIINICALNAYIIYDCNNPNARMPRRNFLKELGKELVKPYQLNRLEFPQIPKKMRKLLSERLQIESLDQEEAPTIPKRKRCYICPRSRNRFSKQICLQCKKNICSEHIKTFCSRCLNT